MTNQAFINRIAMMVEAHRGDWYHDGLEDRVVCVSGEKNGETSVSSCVVSLLAPPAL
jgi:hypothetical protein